MSQQGKLALISGFGPGLAEALGKAFLASGYSVAGLSRTTSLHLEDARFRAYVCDVTQAAEVASTIANLKREFGAPSVVVHNAAAFHMGDFLATNPADFEALWKVNCLGAVHLAQAVLPDMLACDEGTLIFSGATASVRGSANFSAFAASKFALRGLAQSLARAYGPKGIHVAHILLDGVIWGDRAKNSFGMAQEQCMHPAAIAKVYLDLVHQAPSAWTHELDLRPFREVF